MTQDVTISLPDELLHEVKQLAADRGMSLPELIASVLEEHLGHQRAYEAARAQQQKLMADGVDLGTNGNITWTRDELHER